MGSGEGVALTKAAGCGQRRGRGFNRDATLPLFKGIPIFSTPA